MHHEITKTKSFSWYVDLNYNGRQFVWSFDTYNVSSNECTEHHPDRTFHNARASKYVLKIVGSLSRDSEVAKLWKVGSGWDEFLFIVRTKQNNLFGLNGSREVAIPFATRKNISLENYRKHVNRWNVVYYKISERKFLWLKLFGRESMCRGNFTGAVSAGI